MPWVAGLVGFWAMLGAAVWAGAGCSARAPLSAPGVDCDAGSPYDIWIVDSFSPGSSAFEFTAPDASAMYWYSYGDLTPDAGTSETIHAIEGSGRCGSRYALLLESHGHNDYGSGFGTYNFAGMVRGSRGIDAGNYEGVSFWARSFDPSGNPVTKGATFELGDLDTFNTGLDGGCLVVDGGMIGNGAVSVSYAAGGAGGGGAVSAQYPPGACGNNFTLPILTTGEWQFYAIPFASFHQMFDPRRVAGGFDPTTFAQFLVVAPREAALELWIDEIGFYRQRTPDGG
ncbi:MAG: hypothetical protein JOZ69_18960 [Myxococcales bacterium]|nr:hypothetical protein [Myxococcales bacterium]